MKYLSFIFVFISFISCGVTQQSSSSTNRISGVLYTADLKPMMVGKDTIKEITVMRTLSELDKGLSELKRWKDTIKGFFVTFDTTDFKINGKVFSLKKKSVVQ